MVGNCGSGAACFAHHGWRTHLGFHSASCKMVFQCAPMFSACVVQTSHCVVFHRSTRRASSVGLWSGHDVCSPQARCSRHVHEPQGLAVLVIQFDMMRNAAIHALFAPLQTDVCCFRSAARFAKQNVFLDVSWFLPATSCDAWSSGHRVRAPSLLPACGNAHFSTF